MNRFPILLAGLAGVTLGASTGAAQERANAGPITAGTPHALSEASRLCVTPLELRATAAVREPTCRVEAVQLIGSREASRMYAVQYRRSALVEWTEPADSVEWDELVLFRSVSGADSVVPLWHVRTERDIWHVIGAKAQTREGILLIEVLSCLNGTGGCSRDYLVDSAAGLEYVTKRFVKELREQLAPGERLAGGMMLDLETLHGTWPVARPGDPNEDTTRPSKVFDYAVRLEGTELILVKAVLRSAGEVRRR